LGLGPSNAAIVGYNILKKKSTTSFVHYGRASLVIFVVSFFARIEKIT